MTIFTSRSAESYDRWPYADPQGQRWDAEGGVCWPESGPDAGQIHEWSNILRHDPRPYFEPTRDPLPVENIATGTRYPDWECGLHFTGGDETLLRWAPRDRNRNRILIAFRVEAALQLAAGGFGVRAQARLWLDRNEGAEDATPAEVEHSRKVLTRLANVYGED